MAGETKLGAVTVHGHTFPQLVLKENLQNGTIADLLQRCGVLTKVAECLEAKRTASATEEARIAREAAAGVIAALLHHVFDLKFAKVARHARSRWSVSHSARGGRRNKSWWWRAPASSKPFAARSSRIWTV